MAIEAQRKPVKRFPRHFLVITAHEALRLAYGKNSIAVVGWFTFHCPVLQYYHFFFCIFSCERLRARSKCVRSLSRVRKFDSAGLAIVSAILCMRV